METDRSYFQLVEVGESTEFDFLDTTLPQFGDYIRSPRKSLAFDPGYVGRLELLSYDIYNNVQLWWVIALTNGIDDPWDNSRIGTLVLMPSVMDIFEFYSDNYVSLDEQTVQTLDQKSSRLAPVQIGVGNGSTVTFTKTDLYEIVPTTLKVYVDTIGWAQDNGVGSLSPMVNTFEVSGTAVYSTGTTPHGTVSVTFVEPPAVGAIVCVTYQRVAT